MRTWIRNGVRVGGLMAAIAGVGAGLASSRTMTSRFTLASDRDGDRETADRAPAAEATGTDQASPVASRRGPVAGAAGLAVTALGVTLVIRRRRRAARAGQG